jgi:hypothetical protein
MVDVVLNVPHQKVPLASCGLSPCCQTRKLRSVGLLQNVVSDWVEGELTFWNAFHPITPSTTINVCELHIKFCEKCVIDRPYFI